MSPKISLILPCYNSVKYIEETLITIQNQHDVNLELILVDGGSTDGTMDVVCKYRHLFSYIISEPDRGQTDAINKGINHCTGDIFYWINADDYLEPDVLFKVAEEYNSKPFDILCVNNRYFESSNNKTIQYSKTTFYNTLEETIPYAGMSITMFYDLNKAKELFPLSENLHYAMDFELYFRFILKFGLTGLRYSDIPIVTHFRVHEESKTIQQEMGVGYTDLNAIHITILKQINAPEFIVQHYSQKGYCKEYEKYWELSKINRKKLVGYYSKRISLIAYSNHQYKEAKKAILCALKSKVRLKLFDWYRLIILTLFPFNLIEKLRNIRK